MDYRLYFEVPQQHFIRIEMDLPASMGQATEVRLSKWRPGRYELGPYVENIVDVRAISASGKELAVTKMAYNHWLVADSGQEAATLHYRYHAIAPDAGGSHFDERQAYVNGVNLFMYLPAQLDAPCTVELNLPPHYLLACGLQREGKKLFAADFHELVDCPFIASPTLQHHAFDVCGITHNLWFQGEARPDFGRIEADFARFGEAQTTLFGGFPVKEYHYLFQIHSKPFYHGVEHHNSTVLAFGPGYKLMQAEMYQELLGLCSHELFHTWNVKAIRPADMRPYDYDRMNYSRLHYVTEGVTTYYGDLMLLKSGVWGLPEFLSVFNDSALKKHYANDGRNHLSLEQASFDSWLNGYKPGVPNRKISFYTKGALAAFILDYRIRQASHNEKSLDTVMREMYDRFGKTGAGYTKADYRAIAEAHSGIDLSDYFIDVIEGTVPLEPLLKAAANYVGLDLVLRKPATVAERLFGFQIEDSEKVFLVKQVWENGPASFAGLSVGDEPVAINQLRVSLGNFESVLAQFEHEQEVHLTIFRSERLQEILLRQDPNYTLERYMLVPLASPTEEQITNRKAWAEVH
jgi:predicted metalloprotease with PDZ domain